MENRNGLVVDTSLTKATGTARIAAPAMLPGSYPLRHLTCSRPGFTDGDEHEAGQHGNA